MSGLVLKMVGERERKWKWEKKRIDGGGKYWNGRERAL